MAEAYPLLPAQASAAYPPPGPPDHGTRSIPLDDPETWRQQQQLLHPPRGLRRYSTRRVKLINGSVLSIDYPVPAAIRRSVQPQYKHSETNNEEFTRMRCQFRSLLFANLYHD